MEEVGAFQPILVIQPDGKDIFQAVAVRVSGFNFSVSVNMRLFLEAAIRIELMNKAFAELCLTTWLRRLF